ncbi:hypothetical protein TraAM80_01901 [Trypanosoma rangeli]|uniref:Uncharacterized protein n=1 Tax=Trypanosoma rangeli TaxID=5698 RepID=A0A3S5IS45_TRYRA|nr:uncharacterized protein TraAM80_01901 [Trypanosoma rangeli]RNF09875.1 hypothetical protein TraAM80_01901 [Trypanosoma rangeli]|eukprot:RNF09875.1 hypothetical protein TraAM80_01901 [Trypanosoma rangeli]
MRAESEDARSELRRRMRDVVRVIDETLLLHGRRTSTNNLPRYVAGTLERGDFFSSLPHVSSEAEFPSEQRRRELQEQREDAQRHLESLKRARERRGKRREVAPERSDASAPLIVPSHCRGLDLQRQLPAPLMLTTPDTPAALDSSLNQMHDVQEGGGSSLAPPEALAHVAVLEEEFRRRLTERRAEEQSRLEELRTVRRTALATREKALAEAQVQIERMESERIAKVLQIEGDVRRSLAVSQECHIPTEEEIRAIEAHEEALAALRAHTGIGTTSAPPVHLPAPSFTSAIALSASHGDSSLQRGGAPIKATRSPPVDGVFAFSTPLQTDLSSSPMEPGGTSLPSPCNYHHTVAVCSRSGSPASFPSAGQGMPENRTPSPSLPFPPPVTSAVATVTNERKGVSPTTLSSTAPSQARRLLSPSVTSSTLRDSVSNSPAKSLLPSQFLFLLRGRGILADVLPSEGRIIPTLVRLSKDGREVLLLVERLERTLNGPSRTSPTARFRASPSLLFALPQGKRQKMQCPREERAASQHEQEQQREKSGVDRSSKRRVREIYHLSLVDGLLLYPHGSLASGPTGSISSIVCGTRARQLLLKYACTLFDIDKALSYFLIFISHDRSHHENGAVVSLLPNRRHQGGFTGAAVLVLRFRCRWDWIAFLLSVTATTAQWQRTSSLSYGRALWMLAAQLWQRQRSNFVLCTTTKHHKVLPLSILSYSPAQRVVRAPSAGATSEACERSKKVRAAPARFAVPPPHDGRDSNENDHNTTSRGGGKQFNSGDEGLQTGHRSRFGLRPVTTSNGFLF